MRFTKFILLKLYDDIIKIEKNNPGLIEVRFSRFDAHTAHKEERLPKRLGKFKFGA